jgi:hypothetical protein
MLHAVLLTDFCYQQPELLTTLHAGRANRLTFSNGG